MRCAVGWLTQGARGRIPPRGFVHGLVAVAVALAVAGAGQRPTSAQEPPAPTDTATFTLTGEILDGLIHEPVIAAVIKVPALRRFAFTDVNGRFHFADFPEGTWEIIVEHLGYNTVEGTVTLAEGNGLFLRMTPNPVALEGFKVMTRSDRLLAERRQRFPFRVTKISPRMLTDAINADPTAIFRRNSLSYIAACPGTPKRAADWMTPDCVMKRGGPARISIYLDEFPMSGGMIHLSAMPKELIHSMDWIAETAQLRVYTKAFIQRLDEGAYSLERLIW